MARIYIFSDESGNLDFSRGSGATRYFAVGTLAMSDEQPSLLRAALLSLRQDLAWRGHGLDSSFHATTDRQAVRDEVFQLLNRHEFRADVTLLEKSKAQPEVRTDPPTFYRYAMYYHLKHLIPKVTEPGDSLMMVASELGTKKLRASYRDALEEVVEQCAAGMPHRVAFWPTHSDPCLQASDYVLWAVTRKWERRDDRSEVLIRHRIHTLYDLWAQGSRYYY